MEVQRTCATLIALGGYVPFETLVLLLFHHHVRSLLHSSSSSHLLSLTFLSGLSSPKNNYKLSTAVLCGYVFLYNISLSFFSPFRFSFPLSFVFYRAMVHQCMRPMRLNVLILQTSLHFLASIHPANNQVFCSLSLSLALSWSYYSLSFLFFSLFYIFFLSFLLAKSNNTNLLGGCQKYNASLTPLTAAMCAPYVSTEISF